MENWKRWLKIGVVLVIAWFVLKIVFNVVGFLVHLLVIAGLIFIVYSVFVHFTGREAAEVLKRQCLSARDVPGTDWHLARLGTSLPPARLFRNGAAASPHPISSATERNSCVCGRLQPSPRCSRGLRGSLAVGRAGHHRGGGRALPRRRPYARAQRRRVPRRMDHAHPRPLPGPGRLRRRADHPAGRRRAWPRSRCGCWARTGASTSSARVDKNAQRGLPEDLHDSFVEWIVQDLVSAKHPGAALVMPHAAAGRGRAARGAHDVRDAGPPVPGRVPRAVRGAAGAGGGAAGGRGAGRGGARPPPPYARLRGRGPRGGDGAAAGAAGGGSGRARGQPRVPGGAAGGPDRGRLGPAQRTSGAGPDSKRGDRWTWRPIPRDRDNAFSDYEGMLARHGARHSCPTLTRFGPRWHDKPGLHPSPFRAGPAAADGPGPRRVGHRRRLRARPHHRRRHRPRRPAGCRASTSRWAGRSWPLRCAPAATGWTRRRAAFYGQLASDVDVRATDEDDRAEVERLRGRIGGRAALRLAGRAHAVLPPPLSPGGDAGGARVPARRRRPRRR